MTVVGVITMAIVGDDVINLYCLSVREDWYAFLQSCEESDSFTLMKRAIEGVSSFCPVCLTVTL